MLVNAQRPRSLPPRPEPESLRPLPPDELRTVAGALLPPDGAL
jgi:hypothetical protein